MKRFQYSLLAASLMAATTLLTPSQVYAQCYQNGVPCPTGSMAVAGQPASTSGTQIMGTDGTNNQTILTDSSGRVIMNVNQLPALPTGANTIGSIANTGFNVTGTLPGYATTPTFNLGTLNGAALDTSVQSVKTTLGSPFQAGGSIANTAFGISGQLPAFAATPTFNIGTAPTLTVNSQGAVTTAAPSYTNATNNSLSLTTAGALRTDSSATTQPVSGAVTANIGTTNGLALDASLNGLFKSGQSIGNTVFGATESGTWNVGLTAGSAAIGTVGVTALPALPTGTNSIGLVTGQASVTTAAPTYSNGTTQSLSLTPGGALRVDGSAVTQPVSGTVNLGTVPNLNVVNLTGTNSIGTVGLNTGTNAIGTVGVTALPALPTGSNAIGTVGVTALPALPAGSNAIGTVGVTSLPALPTGANTIGAVNINGTVPVSGTVTANLGTLNGAALDTSVQATTTAVTNMSTQLHNDLTGGTPSGTNTIGNILRSVAFSESTTALAVSGSVTGASHDVGALGAATPYNYYTCFAWANTAGTMVLQGSNNNSTFFPIATVAVAASTPSSVSTRIFTRYYQCKYTNGTSLQTTFFLNSGLGE